MLPHTQMRSFNITLATCSFVLIMTLNISPCCRPKVAMPDILSRWFYFTGPVKTLPKQNWLIHKKCKTMRNVVSSAAEAEICRKINNGKTAIGIWPSLIALKQKQQMTPIKTANSTTDGFFNSGMKPKRSKTRDMKWHCVNDKEVLKQLRLYWYNEKNNSADYFTKHHPPTHRHKMRPWYIHT